jgi:hypothetical protein
VTHVVSRKAWFKSKLFVEPIQNVVLDCERNFAVVEVEYL